ncbi:hypothetical protein ABWI01_14100 [Oceanicaulis alexandrii]|uniref:hypothetical protein n=1 Tax=Oceanicaulis alexandrii TaxID=153233 RepID=UPI0035CEF9D0
MLTLLFSALALQLTPSVGEVRADIAFAELAHAWASGDAGKARAVFHTAFAEQSEGPCAISPYTAELAYRTGLLWRSGYHFNMALLIDEQVDALTRAQRELAQEMQTEPGELLSEDRQYLSSPYLNPGLELGVCPDHRMPTLPEPQAGGGEEALVYLRTEWRGPRFRREVSDAVFLDGYPSAEGPELAALLIGLRTYGEERGWRVAFFSFGPCYSYSYRREVISICRPGFERDGVPED